MKHGNLLPLARIRPEGKKGRFGEKFGGVGRKVGRKVGGRVGRNLRGEVGVFLGVEFATVIADL